jgi:hypothetical protein
VTRLLRRGHTGTRGTGGIGRIKWHFFSFLKPYYILCARVCVRVREREEIICVEKIKRELDVKHNIREKNDKCFSARRDCGGRLYDLFNCDFHHGDFYSTRGG